MFFNQIGGVFIDVVSKWIFDSNILLDLFGQKISLNQNSKLVRMSSDYDCMILAARV